MISAHSRPGTANRPGFLTPIERAAGWVAELKGVRRAGFAILIGALSVLAFAPVHAWPVLFLTFGALVWFTSLEVTPSQGREVK